MRRESDSGPRSYPARTPTEAGSPRRLTLRSTPTYASWLNQVEISLSIFARDVLRDAVRHSKAELIGQIMEYIRHYSSERAQPFRWTYAGKPLAA
jgi:putative transposase